MRLIRGAQVLFEGTLQKKDILFDEQSILKVADEIQADAEIIDGRGKTVLPGLVDVHVHFREPGQEEKETIRTGSLAAAHGGFTSVFAMPNVHPYPDNPQTMKQYLQKIKQDSVVHTYAYGTISQGEKGSVPTDYEALSRLGIHWFSDDGVGMNNPEIMKKALAFSQKNHALIACHTEDMKYRMPGACVHDGRCASGNGWTGIQSACESSPLKADLKLAQSIHGSYHACHISAQESVQALRQAKKNGSDVSAEATAHHLLLEDRDVKGPLWKMNPPLRSHEDRMSLIEGLEDGTIDFIASDHAPHTAADKAKPMADAAFGIVSLETSFPLLYTEFVWKQKRWSLNQLVEWMSYLPARRFGLWKTGRIQEGWKSDMTIVTLDRESVIQKEKFYSKGRNTPFDGWSVRAEIKETIVSGRTVFREEK